VIRLAKHGLLKGILFFLLAISWGILAIPDVSLAADSIPRITIQELKSKMDNQENIFIIDVRTGEDYASTKVKIKGAVRIPVDRLADRYKEIPADSEIITYCS
jgi:3-mercaptopyruvate sulfurtransferase SseA